MSQSRPALDKLGPFPFYLARKSHLLTPTLVLPKHPLLDGKPIHMRRKEYLKEALLVEPNSEGDVAPELDSSSTYASRSKEVLVLFAPPPGNSQVHPDPMPAVEENTVKFTEGTEANKGALITDEPIIDSSSTSSKEKARVILPLPKRSQRQSARLTARVEVARLAPKAAPKADCIASAPAPKGRAQSDENDKDSKNSTRPNTSWRIVKFAEDA